MNQQHQHWHPTWYRAEHSSNWDRVKEAIRRDWQQTRHDLHMGGHELNQRATDTMKQAVGKEALPSINDANPPKVIGTLTGEWEAVEPSFEYGYSARHQFGRAHAGWDDKLEQDLKREWEAAENARKNHGSWDEVRDYVRRGYEYKS